MWFRRRRRPSPPATASSAHAVAAEVAEQVTEDEAALFMGAALVNHFVGWTEWCHRRVDSIQPLDGDHGRRKQSIDCTPPSDARLLLNPAHRGAPEIQSHHGQMILPIALVEKASLRHFDARDSSGCPLPVLNSDEIAAFELDMLQFMLSVDNVTLLPGWRTHLRDLIGSGERSRSSQKVTRLLDHGTWGDARIWREKDTPNDFTKDMLRNFASHFCGASLFRRTNLQPRVRITWSFIRSMSLNAQLSYSPQPTATLRSQTATSMSATSPWRMLTRPTRKNLQRTPTSWCASPREACGSRLLSRPCSPR